LSRDLSEQSDCREDNRFGEDVNRLSVQVFAARVVYYEKTSAFIHNNYYDIFTIQNRVFVFMELAEGGDMTQLVKDGALTESRAIVFYKQIADALRYINSMGHQMRKCFT
jgi:hypothetical protein